MKFDLVDRITELLPGQRICTIKSLTLAEEYLADHFAQFAVMPGVLMLESLVQSAGWCVRATEQFAHSVMLLETARNVVYKSFVRPGQVLCVEADCKKLDGGHSIFSGRGFCQKREVFKARITLRHLNLADQDPRLAEVDRSLVEHAKSQFALIGGTSLERLAAG